MGILDSAHARTGIKWPSLTVLVAALVLAGCKPKDTKVTGQIFIATAGGASVRLGAVEVQLIDKQQVTESLSHATAVIESQRTACLRTLESARAHLLKTEDEKLSEQIAYQTNADYVEKKTKLDSMRKEIEALGGASETWRNNNERFQSAAKAVTDAAVQGVKADQQIASWSGFSTAAQSARWQAARVHVRQVNAAVDYYNALDNVANTLFRQLATGQPRTGRALITIPSPPKEAWAGAVGKELDWRDFLKSAMDGLRVNADRLDQRNLEAAALSEKLAQMGSAEASRIQAKLETARGRVASAQAELDSLSALERLLGAFRPTPFKQVNTDADGNFTISYPRGRAFALFAQAQRATMSAAPEKYCWLIDAPAQETPPRILLNNNNLIEVDPDHYLSLKFRRTDGSQ